MELNRSIRQKKKRRNRQIVYGLLGVLLILYTLFWKAYNDVNRTSNNIFNSLETNNKRDSQVVIEATQPISFAFLGIDKGIYGPEMEAQPGRSDAILIGTVNPNTRTTTLVSIPRDTYSLMVDYDYYGDWPYYDKLTHAYAFGDAEMAVNSIQELINVPIDYYVEVNMQGLIDIVDAIDGIEVVSPLTFEYEGNHFTKNKKVKINGKEALAFARMRKTDPEGDFGRQKREKMVIKAILDKVLSFGSISNYQSILETLEDNVKTNLKFEDIVSMYSSYGKSLEQFNTENLIGEELWVDDIYYLYTYPEDRLKISNTLRNELELDEITMDDMTLFDVDYVEQEQSYYEEDYTEDYSEY